MRALAVQAPFVQLNAPYPAIHYLAAWLRSRSIEVGVEDHSIELYRRIFSRDGLSRVFDEVERRLGAGALSGKGQAEIERYLSYRPLYEAWIEPTLSYLGGGDPAFAHRLSAAVEFPRGARVEALLESRDRRPGTEDAPRLASLLLEDLGDLIVHAVDGDFGTIHYGERLGRSRDDFGGVLHSLESSWLMRELYRPLLRERFAAMKAAPDLLVASLPFPGTLVGALALASEARAAFGDQVGIAFGGGYVSTELRGLRDPRLFDFCDWLCFDSGYAGLDALLDSRRLGGSGAKSLYRTMTRRDGRIVSSCFPEGDLGAEPLGCAGGSSPFPPRLVEPATGKARALAVESEAIARVHPDWRDFDSTRYLRPIDSSNPMHRLWSESPWLKYRLAQGCYWKRCAFCDTELDYVSSFVQVELEPLFAAVEAASERTGLRGLHFVDEALPMGKLLAFATENRRRAALGKTWWHYWGNIRFDPSWTEGRVELLAASGLVAVSGGIEVASEEGLAMTDKGFDLAGLVGTLVALRRAGLLVHAYLIYGFPGQDEAAIVESAEFVRGLFATGLVDSAFWHRFVLTRHSRMFADWREGRRPDLVPRDRGGSFAANDLEFEGETEYEKYGEILDRALGAWMEGEELERHASDWFGAGPRARARKGTNYKYRRGAIDGVAKVEALIEAAEAARESRPLPEKGRAYWVAGLPRIDRENPLRLLWARRGTMEGIELGDEAALLRLRDALSRLAAEPEGEDFSSFRRDSGLAHENLLELREQGLVILEGGSPPF